MVSELTRAEIERLQPEIPVLDDVLEQLRGRVALEVEIKNGPDEPGYEPSGATVARDVVEALRRHVFTDAFVSSFDLECLKSVREADPDVATGILVEPARDLDHALELTVTGGHAWLLPSTIAVLRAGIAFVDRVHEFGVHLCTWIVDDTMEMERLFRLGVDGVETNDPALAVSVRDGLLRR